MGKPMFKVGDKVKIASDNDNENYDKFRGKTLIVTHVAKNTDEHRGYDDSMEGMALYDFRGVPFSLYEYELESSYAKGSTIKGGGIELEDKVKIVANLEDHEGYKGQVVEVIGYDDMGYLTVESSDGTQWYVGEEEVKLVKKGSGKHEAEIRKQSLKAKKNIEDMMKGKYAKGSTIDGGDWFWNHAYRHYMRDASKKDRDSVKQKFIKSGLPLNGESPKHAYIVVSTVSPKNLKHFEKISDTEIKYAKGSTVKGGNAYVVNYFKEDISDVETIVVVANSEDEAKDKAYDLVGGFDDVADIEEMTIAQAKSMGLLSKDKYAKGSTVKGGGAISRYRLVPYKERMKGYIESVGEKQVVVESTYEGASQKAVELLYSERDFVTVDIVKLGKSVLSSKKIAKVNSQGIVKYAKGSTVGGKKYQYYILQTKDGKVNWVVPKKIATIEEIVENAKKYNINIFASNFGTWESKRENGNRYTTEIVNEDGSDFKTDKEYNEISRAIGVVKKVKYGNGGGVAVSSENGLAVGTNADLLMNQQNLQYAHGGGVGKVRMKLQDEGGFDEYLEEINFDFNKNKIEFEDENIIIVSKEIAEEFENDSVAYVLIGNELYKKGSTLPTFEKLPKNRQANKKYKYFAVGKDDGKIVNGWEIVSDLESLKYYAKGDLKDMDLKPSDFKIISKERLMRSGINPFDYDNWRKIDYSNDMPYIPKAKKGTNIKGKKSKGGIKIESYLPIFSGFYNTIFEANEEMYIEEPYSYDDYDFNYEKYRLDVAKACVDAIETQLNDLGISVSVKFQELNSPREYNFRNDRIDVEYTLGANSLNEIHSYLLENKDAFSEYVKDNYTSRSGFHSFHSNQSDEWLDNIKNGTDLDHKLGAVLDFILQNENYTDDKLYYDVMDNVYLEADLKEGVRDNEEYINEYAKDNYLNKTQSEVVSDLISHFEENDIEYNEDKVTEIVNNYYLSVGNQSLDLFSTKKGKKKMEQGGGVNGWCYEVGGL